MGIVFNVLQQVGDARSRYLQLGEGKHLFTEVFQRGSDVIYVRSVYNQEAVVTFLVGMGVYRRALAVVLLQIQLQLVADGLRVNVSFHTSLPFAEHQQHRFIHVVVYQQQGFPGGAYQVDGELIGVE